MSIDPRHHPAPQRVDESDRDFLLRWLEFHRESHQIWVDHIKRHDPATCKCVADSAAVAGLETKEEDVRRYDRLIEIVKSL